jgi:hypothetical protein
MSFEMFILLCDETSLLLVVVIVVVVVVVVVVAAACGATRDKDWMSLARKDSPPLLRMF